MIFPVTSEEKSLLKKHSSKKKLKNELFKTLYLVSFFSGIGIYFAVTIGVFLYLGMLFDEYFASTPKGKIFALIISFPAAIYFIYKKVRSFHL